MKKKHNYLLTEVNHTEGSINYWMQYARGCKYKYITFVTSTDNKNDQKVLKKFFWTETHRLELVGMKLWIKEL